LPEKLHSLTTQSASVVVVVLVSDHFAFEKHKSTFLNPKSNMNDPRTSMSPESGHIINYSRAEADRAPWPPRATRGAGGRIIALAKGNFAAS